MRKRNKEGRITWKQGALVAGVASLLLIVPTVFNHNNTPEEATEDSISQNDGDILNSSEVAEVVEEDDSIYYELNSFEDLKSSFYDGSVSATQLQKNLNNYLDFHPTFKTALVEEEKEEVLYFDESGSEEGADDGNVEKVEAAEAEEEPFDEDTHAILTAYLDGLFIQQNRLNKMVSLVEEEFRKIEELTGETLPNDAQEIEGLTSPVVEGIMQEMHNTPLYIYSDEGNFSVWVDYKEINDTYSDYFNEFHIHLTRLHRDVIRFGYTRQDGEIDAKVVYNRLLLIEDIQDGDVSKDNYYWENERYQLAVLFTGYGDDELAQWDETRLEQMLEIAHSTTEPNKYIQIAEKLTESFNKEDGYREETLRIANRFMHEEFEEYSHHIEQLGKENAE